MTPYELSLTLEAHQERQLGEMKDKLTLVWLGEYYHRTKRLPSLKGELDKLSDENKSNVMTDEEMLETVKRLNAQFGGTIVKNTKE